MNAKKICITQSNYIPWKGYFDIIRSMDEVILYDDMQYTKRDWRNRNQIKTPQGLLWLSIPVEVKGKYRQAIKDTRISDSHWAEKHWRTLQLNYARAPHFKAYEETIAALYLQCGETFLSAINYRFLEGINRLLGIDTPMRFSSDFQLAEGQTQRLVDLCKQAGATDYYSGPSARDYLDESLFNQEGIRVHYFDFSGYPEYPQLYPPFEHSVTALDLIFNTGVEALQYMKKMY